MTDTKTLCYIEKKRRWYEASEYSMPKWIQFCDQCMALGFELRIYDSRSSVSKYIWVSKQSAPDKEYKVRFSNHKPSRCKEMVNDCDFYVGISHGKVCTMWDVLRELKKLLIKDKKDERNATNSC